MTCISTSSHSLHQGVCSWETLQRETLTNTPEELHPKAQTHSNRYRLDKTSLTHGGTVGHNHKCTHAHKRKDSQRQFWSDYTHTHTHTHSVWALTDSDSLCNSLPAPSQSSSHPSRSLTSKWGLSSRAIVTPATSNWQCINNQIRLISQSMAARNNILTVWLWHMATLSPPLHLHILISQEQ